MNDDWIEKCTHKILRYFAMREWNGSIGDNVRAIIRRHAKPLTDELAEAHELNVRLTDTIAKHCIRIVEGEPMKGNTDEANPV